jgi:glutamine synthetase
MIYAILDGIENNRTLPRPTDKIISQAQNENGAEPEKLPDSFEQACAEAQKSDLIQQFIPSSVTGLYCKQ